MPIIVRDIDGNLVEIPADEAEIENARLGFLAMVVGLSTGMILGLLRMIFGVDWLFYGLFFDSLIR